MGEWKRGPKDISVKVGKPVVPTLNDLQKMKDLELVRSKKDNRGNIVMKDKYTVYEKNPLIAHVPLSYFTDTVKSQSRYVRPEIRKQNKKSSASQTLRIPSENEILDICKNGEDQIYEFKAPGVDTNKIVKEIAALLNTKNGGLLFYCVEDDGTIVGTDIRRQDLDQRLQNSVKNMISPSATVNIRSVKALGNEIIVVVVPPWNRKDVYQHDGRILIRKGTNVFAAKPEEVRKLHDGIYVV